MSATLFLCHRLPYPPNKGDKIRSFHILKKLSQISQVYLGTLVDDPLDWNHVSGVNDYVVDSCIIERRSLKRHWPQCLSGMMQGKPLTNVLFYSPELKFWVDSLIKHKRIDKIYVFSSAMAQYVLEYADKIPIITDFVDVDSLKWAQYAQSKWFPLNMLYKLEASRLKHYEAEVANKSKASIFVSNQEVALFRKSYKDMTSKVISIQNGVDTSYFNPELKFANPYQGNKKRLLFTGLMDYWPNIDAVQWFVKEVFTKVSYIAPEVEFYICGANPTKAVFKLSRSNVIVTGRVPDMRPYLQHADIIVAPLRIARGIQNKVLEALSMSKLIVASPQALEGITCPRGDFIWEESDVQGWVNKIIELIQPENTAQANTHSWVKANYSWEAHLNQIDKVLEPKEAIAQASA